MDWSWLNSSFKNSKWFLINVVFLRRMQPPAAFCMRYLRTINALKWGVLRGGGCRSLGWTRCSLTSPMNQSQSECTFKQMMTDRRWQNWIKVELSNFGANIEREREKDFERDIAALFPQLTQVLNNVTNCSCLPDYFIHIPFQDR